MTRYEVKKYDDKGIVADYGSFTNYDDVKEIIKGYKLDEDMKALFNLNNIYTRGTTKTYYVVEEYE